MKLKIACGIPDVIPADINKNTTQIIDMIKKADGEGCRYILFPELAITGASCGDLFKQQLIAVSVDNALKRIVDEISDLSITSVIGFPLYIEDAVFSACAVIKGENIKYSIRTEYGMPDYEADKSIFTKSFDIKAYEKYLKSRVFSDIDIAVNIGNNIYTSSKLCRINFNPSSHYAVAGYSPNELIGAVQSKINNNIYVYLSSCCGESSTDRTYIGKASIYQQGKLVSSYTAGINGGLFISEIDWYESLANESGLTEKRMKQLFFNELNKNQDFKRPFLPCDASSKDEYFREILEIQARGLAIRLKRAKIRKIVLGISGGLDSTLALLVVYNAFKLLDIPMKNALLITMPGFGTSDKTFGNARLLAESLGTELTSISIKEACERHFEDIGHDIEVKNSVYENSQARERTQILMDLANKENALVVGTGDMSELALGWCTFNGDHISNYAVNAGVPKTLIQEMVSWYADICGNRRLGETLKDIVATPISPELLPTDDNNDIAQKTENLVGPYELHDFFLYHFISSNIMPSGIFKMATKAFDGIYTDKEIYDCLVTFIKRFFSQQFKRSCSADGTAPLIWSLSPRGGHNMPSDSKPSMWLYELGKI